MSTVADPPESGVPPADTARTGLGDAIPSVPGVITASEILETAASIVALQRDSGMIQWYEGGHADPWNHVEAAMALAVAGEIDAACKAYDWLETEQLADGSWFNYYIGDGVEDFRKDTNVCAYVAAGVWHHFLVTGDTAFLVRHWPMVERAIDFVLSLQCPGGEISWCIEPDGARGNFALLTGSSSIFHSLRCAIAIAQELGMERPGWRVAAGLLGRTVAHRKSAFEPKERWAMDWYYPVLCGAVEGDAADERIEARWNDFVVTGMGVRCVSDQPWITAAETAECVIALDAAGMTAEALEMLGWAQFLRDHDGAYWTGWVFPDDVHFPGGERTTYTSAAVILAAHCLSGTGPAAGLFRGEGLPAIHG